MCVCLNRSCVRSFAGCADLNLAGRTVEEGLVCRKFSDAVMTIFSGQSVISRVYTSRFGNGTGSHGTSTEVVLKKYQVPGTVPSGKPPKSEPYRTVPCRTTQWKSAIGHLVWSCPKLYEFWSVIFRFYSVAYSCDLSPDTEIACLWLV